MSSDPNRPQRFGRVVAQVSAIALLMMGLAAPVARAATVTMAVGKTYVVNGTADHPDADVGAGACADANGRCTLRAAIMQANFHAGADTISLPAGTYTLTRPGNDDEAVLGDLDITDNLTIVGAGSSRTIVDGHGSVTHDRVFEIFSGAVDTALSGLTIRHGKRTGTFEEGGGLSWQGDGSQLSLDGVVVEDNRAYDGGGISLMFSSLGDVVDLNRLTVRGNKATAAVGGASVQLGAFARFTLRNSRIHANTAYEGGGLYLQGDAGPDEATSLRITNTEVDGNQASLSAGFENHSGTVAVPVVLTDDFFHADAAGQYGGAVGNYGVLDLTGSTLSGNTSASRGAGLYTYAGGTSDLTNVTMAHNVSQGYGGAVYAEVSGLADSSVSMTNVTLRANAATTAGGGIYADPGAVVTLRNSLFAQGSSGANCSAPFGGTSNLSTDGSCGFGGGDGIVDLKLGPLALHGGRTETIVPGVGSPAVNAGTSGGAPADDQRGIERPQGSGVDLGAVEVCLGKPAAPALIAPGNTTVHHRRVVLRWTEVSCIQGYTVVVKRGSRSGPTIEKRAGLQASRFKTTALRPATTYYWRVTAVGDRGKTPSPWRHFGIA